MNLLKENIEEYVSKMEFVNKNEYKDEIINKIVTYYYFLESQETVIQKRFSERLDTILYSKYYWYTKLKDRYTKLYGENVGIYQKQFKIIEEIGHRLNNIDWELIEKIEGDCDETNQR